MSQTCCKPKFAEHDFCLGGRSRKHVFFKWKRAKMEIIHFCLCFSIRNHRKPPLFGFSFEVKIRLHLRKLRPDGGTKIPNLGTLFPGLSIRNGDSSRQKRGSHWCTPHDGNSNNVS